MMRGDMIGLRNAPQSNTLKVQLIYASSTDEVANWRAELLLILVSMNSWVGDFLGSGSRICIQASNGLYVQPRNLQKLT